MVDIAKLHAAAETEDPAETEARLAGSVQELARVLKPDLARLS